MTTLDYPTNNPYTRPLRAPVTLSNGRIVTFEHAWNGSQLASMADTLDMSEQEWQEICDFCRSNP